MPGQQQKPATRQETASKPGEASNAAKAANTAAKNISPSPPETPTPPPNQMAKDISSIYALLRETSESQERKLNSIQSATRAVEAKLSDIATRLNNVESHIDFLEDANRKRLKLILLPHSLRWRSCDRSWTTWKIGAGGTTCVLLVSRRDARARTHSPFYAKLSRRC